METFTPILQISVVLCQFFASVTLTMTFKRFLAHLSQRLIDKLKGYSRSGVCPSVHQRRRGRSQCSKIFSETALPIKAKFYVEPPWERGTIFCSWNLGHMTKMAATPINGKNHLKIFSRTGRPISMKLGM